MEKDIPIASHIEEIGQSGENLIKPVVLPAESESPFHSWVGPHESSSAVGAFLRFFAGDSSYQRREEYFRPYFD